jgi:hypothetical protein
MIDHLKNFADAMKDFRRARAKYHQALQADDDACRCRRYPARIHYLAAKYAMQDAKYDLSQYKAAK